MQYIFGFIFIQFKNMKIDFLNTVSSPRRRGSNNPLWIPVFPAFGRTGMTWGGWKKVRTLVLRGLTLFLIGQNAIAQNCEQPQQIHVKNCEQVVRKNCKPCPSWWEKGWAITLYSGPVTSQTTSKLANDFDFEGAGIVVLAGSKELFYVWDNRVNFELEAQIAQQFNKQNNTEINPIVFIARWRDFPWNETLPTTFAIGDGLSIATQTPKLERKRRSHETNKVLNYVMAELTLSLPECPQWALVARYHHRSGMFGVFNGVHDASTAFAAGIKYWF